GIDGVTSGARASVKRMGQNRVDRILADDDGSGQAEVFLFDFDGSDSSSNVFGPAAPSSLSLGTGIEAQFAGGDSGSPVFVNDNGVWKIAGIAAFNGSTPVSSGSSVKFGAIGGGAVVAAYLPWIQSTLAAPVPEPGTWLMLLVGLGLVGAAKISLQKPVTVGREHLPDATDGGRAECRQSVADLRLAGRCGKDSAGSLQ
ncbi:MAG: PEP-CTERM sorting domain-containing protein, partial [Thiobacillus sp.]|nr:PEP-CTERM sorting domain-containing protein [Thiobacillus sp.]